MDAQKKSSTMTPLKRRINIKSETNWSSLRDVNPAIWASNSYALTLMDDATRKVWVYFMKQKLDALGIFQEWKTLVEKGSGKQVKILRSDNGREFTSK